MTFQKGQITNPKGRPKGSKNTFSFSKLQEAVERVEKKIAEHNKSLPFEEQQCANLYDHIIERAFENDKVLIALMNKIIPTLPVQSEDAGDLVERELELYDLPDDINRIKKFIQ